MSLDLVPLQTYDTRLRAMLMEVIPGTTTVTDWTVGNSGIDWWAILSADQNTVKVFEYGTTLWRIEFLIGYVFATEAEGNKGPVRAKLNLYLPIISKYFVEHIQMTTDDQDSTDIITGYIPGSFRAKYLKERVRKGKRMLPFMVSFNHKAQTKVKEF